MNSVQAVKVGEQSEEQKAKAALLGGTSAHEEWAPAEEGEEEDGEDAEGGEGGEGEEGGEEFLPRRRGFEGSSSPPAAISWRHGAVMRLDALLSLKRS